MSVSGQPHASAALPQAERGPEFHWAGSCVGPRAGVHDLENRLFFLRVIEMWSPRRATHVAVVVSTELSWLPKEKKVRRNVREVPYS
jgi:hypothetical protein